MIERIAKLLNKAENAATVHEAQVYFDKAQALATAHSLSLAKARLHAAPQTAAATVTNRTISVGEPRRHANRHLVRLFAVVGQVNGLTVDILWPVLLAAVGLIAGWQLFLRRDLQS